MTWSYATHYTCDNCTEIFELLQPLNTCPSCGGLLEIQYDLDRMKRELQPKLFDSREPSMWRWHEFYPCRMVLMSYPWVRVAHRCYHLYTPEVSSDCPSCILKMMH